MTTPEVSILIVTWNNKGTVERSIECARRACRQIDHEILVWDNESHDGTASLVANLLSPESLVRSLRNVGFAAGMNALARRARGRHLFLLNPDAYLDETAVTEMLDVLKHLKLHGIVGGRLEGPDGDAQAASARPFPTSWRTALWLIAQRNPYWWPLPTSAGDVDAVSGAFMAVPKDLWRALEGF
ncbi:MAG: glycosyltransferase family 2 protein, partial [Actinobacteria bacterium]|nr:glycosyltransferase family 2 protein [Actinomycetota bacterium]